MGLTVSFLLVSLVVSNAPHFKAARSPFALDFSFDRGTLGALFFNPAKRYAERLTITDAWSRAYVNYPFAK